MEGQGFSQGRRGLRSAALFFVLALTLTGCGLKSDDQATTDTSTDTTTEEPLTTDTTPTTNDLSTITPGSVAPDLDAHYAAAQAAAQAWQADAVLTYVSVDVPTTLATGQSNEVYVFGSASDSANWWTYSVSQATGKFVRALIPKEDYLGADIVPINTDYWTMNYVEAFQLAEANGGAAFRLLNPNSTITLFLSQRAPRGWLWWTAEYAAPSGETFALLANPFRGEVVDEAGTEVAPPADGSSTTDDLTTPTQTDTSDTLTN